MSQFNKYLEIIQEQKYDQNYNYNEGLLSRKIKHAAVSIGRKLGKKVASYLPINDTIMGKIGKKLYTPHILEGYSLYEVIRHGLNLALDIESYISDRKGNKIQHEVFLKSLGLSIIDKNKIDNIKERTKNISYYFYENERILKTLEEHLDIKTPEINEDILKYFYSTRKAFVDHSIFAVLIINNLGNKYDGKYITLNSKYYKNVFFKEVKEEDFVSIEDTKKIIRKLAVDFFNYADSILTKLETYIQNTKKTIMTWLQESKKQMMYSGGKITKDIRDTMNEWRVREGINLFLGTNFEISASKDTDRQKKLFQRTMSNLPRLASKIAGIQSQSARMQLAKTLGLDIRIIQKMAGKTQSEIEDLLKEYEQQNKENKAFEAKKTSALSTFSDLETTWRGKNYIDDRENKITQFTQGNKKLDNFLYQKTGSDRDNYDTLTFYITGNFNVIRELKDNKKALTNSSNYSKVESLGKRYSNFDLKNSELKGLIVISNKERYIVLNNKMNEFWLFTYNGNSSFLIRPSSREKIEDSADKIDWIYRLLLSFDSNNKDIITPGYEIVKP